jgi:hypothetical protein
LAITAYGADANDLRSEMKPARMAIAAALLGAAATGAAVAQQAAAPQTIRLRGTIEKLDGRTVLAKSSKGEKLTLKLADKVLVVAVVKASAADIKPGLFIGSGAMPQPDGSQKAPNPCAAPPRDTGLGTVLPIPP